MSFAPPAKRDENGELLYDVDRCHSRIDPRFTVTPSPGRGRTPFRRIKKRTLVRKISEESYHERNALEILQELEKLGAKSMDWTTFSPTQYGSMKRDRAGSPHSVLHTVFTGGQWQRSRTSSPTVSKQPERESKKGIILLSPTSTDSCPKHLWNPPRFLSQNLAIIQVQHIAEVFDNSITAES